MLKKAVCLCALACAALAPLVAQAEDEKIMREVLIAPVINLTENRDFAHLASTIFNLLLLNFRKQETLVTINDRLESGAPDTPGEDFEAWLAALKGFFPGATAVVTEYYGAADRVHILINVWDLDTLRIKNSFIETVSADLAILKNIETLAAHTAQAVARELPPTERDALFQKQIVTSLRRKINDEEKLVEDIFSGRHEIGAAPFTGVGLGRTVFSWSDLGPLIAPVLDLSYSYFFEAPFHLRVGLEFLCYDVLAENPARNELTFEALFGLHTASSFSFSLDAGLALIYDYNPASGALAYTSGINTITPQAERLSLSIPVALGLTVYFSKNFFISFRLKYHGLTWTVEPLGPESYDVGNDRLKYWYGLSPWNLLCVSVVVQTGVRF